MKKQKRIAVIGAGIAGLTCAYELQKAGYDVVVYEKESHVGGRMSTRTKDGLHFDIGADHLCDLYDHMKAYCKEFGIPWQKMEFLSYNIYKKGHVIPLAKAVSSVREKWRLAWEFMKIKKRTDFFDLSTVSMFDTDNAYEYMKKHVGPETADYLIDPFCSTYQFHRAPEISLAATKAIMESIKHDKPRWYLHHTAGGMKALPEALAKNLAIKKNAAVHNITTGKSVGVVTGDDTQKFDIVVIASTATTTKKILQHPTPEQSRVLEQASYAASMSIAYVIDQQYIPETIGITWVPYIENKIISGYVNEKMKGGDLIQNGKTLVSVWLHEDAATSLMKQSDEAIYTQVKQELLRVCPWIQREINAQAHDIQRWPEAMPKFSHGHIARVKEFLENGQGQNNIFLCGDYLNAPWTEGALRCGQRVATRIIDSL